MSPKDGHLGDPRDVSVLSTTVATELPQGLHTVRKVLHCSTHCSPFYGWESSRKPQSATEEEGLEDPVVLG